MGLAEARTRHRTVREQVRGGNNPVDMKRAERRQKADMEAQEAQEKLRRETETLRKLMEAYAPHAKRNYAPSKILRVFAELLDKPINEVTRQEINRIALSYKRKKTNAAPVAYANSAVNMLRPIFKWSANQYEWVPETLGLIKNPHPKPKRGEHMTDEKIKKLLPVFRASAGHGHLYWFIAHTGCRLNEANSATWDQIDLEKNTWTIPGKIRKNTKNKPNHPELRITLPSQAIKFLREIEAEKEGKLLFSKKSKLSNFDRYKKILQNSAQTFDWHAHDLRHYFKTTLKKLRVRDEVSEEALGHEKKGISGIYDHYNYEKERALALQKLANYLENLTKEDNKQG
jgi:integrase